MLTKEQLLAIMPYSKKYVDGFLMAANKYMEEFDINNRLRICHFLAQVAHESGELRYTEEIASGASYEGRRDLGNTHVGDGRKFKGRGYLQLTGRANYKAYNNYLVSTGINVNLLETPELLAKNPDAFKSAAWFWKTHGLNALADRDDIVSITRRINGGTNGLVHRKLYYQRAKLIIK